MTRDHGTRPVTAVPTAGYAAEPVSVDGDDPAAIPPAPIIDLGAPPHLHRMPPTRWGFPRPQLDPVDRETAQPPTPSLADADAFDAELGEAVDLTVANSARLAIYRILDRLLRDPFDSGAAAELVQVQSVLRVGVKSAQARQANRTHHSQATSRAFNREEAQ